MPSRMMKHAVLGAAMMVALPMMAQAGAHTKCDRLTGHAAMRAGCASAAALPSVQLVAFDEVSHTQSKLHKLGYDLGTHEVDGKLGPNTRAALKAFQRDHALRVDGRIGVQTRTMLNYVTQQYRAYGHRM